MRLPLSLPLSLLLFSLLSHATDPYDPSQFTDCAVPCFEAANSACPDDTDGSCLCSSAATVTTIAECVAKECEPYDSFKRAALASAKIHCTDGERFNTDAWDKVLGDGTKGVLSNEDAAWKTPTADASSPTATGGAGAVGVGMGLLAVAGAAVAVMV